MTMADSESEDQRRYKIYIQINDQHPYGIGKLTTSQYVKLKHNDKAVYDLVSNLFEEKKISIDAGKINSLYRSIDDVDYTPVNLPEQAPSSSLIPAKTTGENCNNEPQLPLPLTPQSKQIDKPPTTVQSETIEPADNDDEIRESVRSSQSSRSKKVSGVWQHFKKENETSARCTICNKVLKHSGNTTNLTQHLNRKHKLLFQSVGEQTRKRESSESSNESGSNHSEVKRMRLQALGHRLQPIDEAFERMTSFASGGKTSDKITNAILYMVAVDEMPFATVENEGFKTLMKTVAPLYTIPSRRTLTKLIDSRYDVLKERCKSNLQIADSYSLTCDVWTDMSNQSYLGVSIHYLSADLVMKNGCLGVVPLYENHTAEYLAKALNFLIDDFHLDRAKITAIVCDSGANIKKAVSDTVGKENQLSCFAHTLSHLVPDAMSTMPALTDIIAKVKSIVTLTRRSVVASDELKRLQIRDGKSEGTALKFVQDVPTRWNSCLYMLERFLLLEEYVYPVLLKCSNSPDMLKREEIQILTDIILIMKPVENVITEVSGESYPTCSIIIPIIRCMEATIQRITPKTELGSEFKTKLQVQIESRFKDFEFNSILGIATVLDPRFKKMHFQSALAASKAITHINKKIERTLQQKLTEKENEPNKREDLQKSIWDIHDNLMSKNSGVSTHDESTNLEIRQYLSQSVTARLKDPFAHWKSLEHAFPVLSKIAMRYVSIVGTSVPSERMFSHAGHIKTEKRNRLSVNPEADDWRPEPSPVELPIS